jgi:arylsulfatase A-like enzyme
MAAEGLTFTDFHSNSSVCSPTRAAFMTGRYQQRAGIVDVIVGNRDKHGLPPSEFTLSRMMKEAGYKTALFGKWHLGQQAEFNPVKHGFDEFVGYLIGAADYHNHKNSWYDGLEKKDQQGYTTHLITDFSTRFIEENQTRPFFLLVTHEAVHLPFQTPADTVEDRVPVPKDKRWSREWIRPKYKIMLEEMDTGIGEILDTLRRCGIEQNTLVFFFSDNGAIGAGSNEPFRGSKFSHYEGGHRVPAIAWWPGRIAAGGRTGELTTGVDILPTVADIAGIDLPEDRQLDGASMKGLVLEGADFPDRQVFFGYEPKLGTAMRDGDWKMIVSSKGVELFDLSRDIGEKNNLAETHSRRAARMQEAIENWKREVGDWTRRQP